jgi:SpoVK/Ycf46/Vps4 family AAA+-type ATPase
MSERPLSFLPVYRFGTLGSQQDPHFTVTVTQVASEVVVPKPAANHASEVRMAKQPPSPTVGFPMGDLPPGVAAERSLPNDEFERAWVSIILPDGHKQRLARAAAATITLRAVIAQESLPLHGVFLLVGPPGTGKTTLGRGLANRIALAVTGLGEYRFLEVDPHGLTSSSLGKSQRAVEQLFSVVLPERLALGPLVVLIDEIETLVTDRSRLSMDANPIDVHRAVDAALVGLDRLASAHPGLVIIATSNFADAIDPALESRADLIFPFDLPDAEAREHILRDTLNAVVEKFPGADIVLKDGSLATAAKASEDLDGRRLRKAVAAACSINPDGRADPNNLTGVDLLAAIHQMKEQQ